VVTGGTLNWLWEEQHNRMMDWICTLAAKNVPADIIKRELLYATRTPTYTPFHLIQRVFSVDSLLNSCNYFINYQGRCIWVKKNYRMQTLGSHPIAAH
jgi:hypothetical protein